MKGEGKATSRRGGAGVPAWLLLCVPEAEAESVGAIRAEDLEARGIRGIVLDLDNTLAPWNGSELDPEAAGWVRAMAERGFRFCIASNTRRPRRLRRLAEQLGVLHVERCGKPGPRGFRDAMAAMGTQPEETTVVGDQIFTDVLGGNRLGLHTILVRRLTRKEFPGTYLSRLCEWVVRGFLRWRGAWR